MLQKLVNTCVTCSKKTLGLVHACTETPGGDPGSLPRLETREITQGLGFLLTANKTRGNFFSLHANYILTYSLSLLRLSDCSLNPVPVEPRHMKKINSTGSPSQLFPAVFCVIYLSFPIWKYTKITKCNSLL